MRAISSGLFLLSALSAAAAFGQERCACRAYNLTPCGGTGPTLRSYLWSDEERGSRDFDVTGHYPGGTREDCRAVSYSAVPREVPVFNYYGYLVHGCAVVWKDCDLR